MSKSVCKQSMSNLKFKRIWTIVLVVIFALTLALNAALSIFGGYADLYLGGGKAVITRSKGTENWDTKYYKMDYSSSNKVEDAAANMVKEVESEGIVLLKNNGALPLATSAANKAKVTLLGRDAADPIYGGSGSGSVNLSTVVDLKSALTNANYDVNETTYKILKNYASFTEKKNARGGTDRVYAHPRANIVMDNPGASTYYIGEMPVEGYTSEAKESFLKYKDAGIVVIGRGGGEGGDLTRDMTKWDKHAEPGQHQLELNYDEKQTLALAENNFDKVIVIINSSNAMELGVLEDDPKVDAILWVGSPGQTGFDAVGDVLNGTVNPSGKTVDIYPADFTKDPTYCNFGNYQYNNVSKSNAIGNAYFVQYEEGIYVGYRYYETAATEKFIDYDKAVVYPFGYGLSYTSFDWNIVGKKLGKTDGSISVDVKVTNTGNVPGKEVVELYYSAPYTKGGIEKSSVVLGDFTKTSLLKPGASETVTLKFAVQDMASYDYKTAKAYVLDAGDYKLTVQSDSHTIKKNCEPINYTVDKKIVYSGNNKRAGDATAATNQFDDVSAMFKDTAEQGYARNMSRADFAGTFPTAPVGKDFVANDAIIKDFQAYVAKDHEDPNAVMPVTKKSNGLSLIDYRGVDYNDKSWDLLLDQMNPKEIVSIILNGAYNTKEAPSLGKPKTVDLDGPAGISAFMGNTHGTSYPSEVIVASTWNTELSKKMGIMVGNEALNSGTSGWYAPAMNIHRSPFAGRNFEYYSEDPVISGKIGTAVVEGCASKGLNTYVKHFAVNDQETNRTNDGVCSWVNEQAMREIYLKDFEMVVKNAQNTIKYISDNKGTVSEKKMNACTAIMSSFNRIGATWSGGYHALQESVLRGEWNFEGVVISDWNLYPYMSVDQSIAAGTDYEICMEPIQSIQDSTSATAVTNLRKTAHRLCYTVANSNAMNGIAPGAKVTYSLATWRVFQIVADIVIALFLIISSILVWRRVRAHK